ncbi:1-deoxy-D-xylulose-5-phosphate reductoisomerase [Candidatus Palauibacter sp.]|uniref:1-deoxy-D-xylulose-5-phosphate reductoisomerase n=1 Tax=Candidatus Palauibacter sp. TaxID=3101350 RepID=UPI003B01B8B4
MKRVAVLGATGSVGAGTLEVIRRHPARFRAAVLTANRSWEALDALALDRDPDFVVLGTPPPDDFAPRWGGEWRFGADALAEAAGLSGIDIVLNAIVGFAGLDATLAALGAGKRLALANKESLVAGGDLVMRALRRGGGELLPVDSEHSAVHQCLAGRAVSEVARVTLTASGGPFREWPADRLATVTPADALRHPTWSMGAKITIDSATLANKALEVIEAQTLFDLPYERIEVVVHPTSIVHSLVEFRDGSSLAQLGRPSMEIPILWALGYPDRLDDQRQEAGFDPVRDGPLEFEPVREDDFPLFRAGVAAGRAGGEFPVAFNAANEIAVEMFLSGDVGFRELADVVLRTLERFSSRAIESVEDARRVDARARTIARGPYGESKSGDAE